MNKMTSLYILWGVVMCLQLAFIFRDTTHIVGYTLEFINPNDLQELSIPLVVKPDVYEPDTLVNTRTGEAIKVAYGQAVKHFWHTFFKNIEQGDFFTTRNERLLRRFGCYQLAGVALLAVFRFIDFLGLRMQLDFEHYRVGFEWFSLLAYAILPACFLFVAEAFRIGTKLREDTDGLV